MANQEQFDLLAQPVEAWNQWKADTHETVPASRWNLPYDADLSGADLRGVKLNEVNLGKVDLAGANFAGAFLLGACLAEAELAEANFVGAHLAGVDLRGANIGAADFTNADLSNADLSGADLSEARFQGANLSGARLDQDELREAQASAEMTHKVNADRQGAKQGGSPFPRRQAQGQEIILYTRPHSRSLRVIGAAIVFVIGMVWLLQRPANLLQVVIEIIALVLSGLGGLLILIFFLRQLFSRTPLLIIDDEGIQYFYPSLLETIEKNPMTRENIILTWQQIGAIGVIKMEKADFFAVYASAKRWRSGWSPSIRFPQSLLPLPVKRLLPLIQERYQAQIAANNIEIVEVADVPSSSR